MAESPKQITDWLVAWKEGNDDALHALVPIVYRQLQQLARRQLRRERPNHTLQTTGLIHEAYLRLFGAREVGFQSREHFYAIAARLMRQVLVDHARKREAARRGGSDLKISLSEAAKLPAESEADILGLNELLEVLGERSALQSRIVELRYFGGFSIEETASVLQTSTGTVKREWRVARAWLYQQMSRE